MGRRSSPIREVKNDLNSSLGTATGSEEEEEAGIEEEEDAATSAVPDPDAASGAASV